MWRRSVVTSNDEPGDQLGYSAYRQRKTDILDVVSLYSSIPIYCWWLSAFAVHLGWCTRWQKFLLSTFPLQTSVEVSMKFLSNAFLNLRSLSKHRSVQEREDVWLRAWWVIESFQPGCLCYSCLSLSLYRRNDGLRSKCPLHRVCMWSTKLGASPSSSLWAAPRVGMSEDIYITLLSID